MTRILRSSVFAAAVLAGSVASAGTVVFDPNEPQPQCANTILVSNLAPGLTVAVAEIWVPGGGCVFPMQFVATKALRIRDIALSATGPAANIGKVRFRPDPGDPDGLQHHRSGRPSGLRRRAPAGRHPRQGAFTIYWAETIDAPVSITAAFATSAIPLPAALPLLAGALGALGLCRRKVKKAA